MEARELHSRQLSIKSIKKTKTERLLFQVTASTSASEPMRIRSFSDIDLTRHQSSELISFRSNVYFSGPAILLIDPPERFMVAGEN